MKKKSKNPKDMFLHELRKLLNEVANDGKHLSQPLKVYGKAIKLFDKCRSKEDKSNFFEWFEMHTMIQSYLSFRIMTNIIGMLGMVEEQKKMMIINSNTISQIANSQLLSAQLSKRTVELLEKMEKRL